MFYLYFVLPPVIIVASLALVIFLISRRLLDAEKMAQMDGVSEENESKLSLTVKARVFGLLERLAHWFKIFSLKMHNWMEEKIRFIRERRSKISRNKEKLSDEERMAEVRNRSVKNKGYFVKKTPIEESDVKNTKTKKSMRLFGMFQKDDNKRDSVVIEENNDFSGELTKEEDVIMVSKEVVYPEKEKEELENVLIERIAADPRDIEAYERLGDYYVSRKNEKDARECYRQVLRLNPRSVSVKKKLEGMGRR